MDADTFQSLLETYEELANVAVPEHGRIISTDSTLSDPAKPVAVTCYWKSLDPRAQTQTVRHCTGLVRLPRNGASGEVLLCSFEPLVDTSAQDHVYCASNRYSVTLSKEKRDGENGGKPKQHIRVFDHERGVNVCSKNMSDVKTHGQIIHSAMMGQLQWSYGEGHLLYCAAKHYEQKGFFDENFAMLSADEQNEKMQHMGSKYAWHQSWGEQLVNCVEPVMAVLNVSSLNVTPLDNIPTDVEPSQAIWAPSDEGVIFVGLDCSREKLGRMFCFNRKSAIYYYDLKTATTTKISPKSDNDVAVAWPTFSPNGKWLVWAERAAGGSHGGAARLMKCNWETKETSIVVDIRAEYPQSADIFPSLEVSYFPFARRCWATDCKRLLVTTQWRSNTEIIVIDVEKTTDNVTRITNSGMCHGSWQLMDVSGDVLLACCSSPCRPWCLLAARLPPAGNESSIVWVRVSDNSAHATRTHTAKYMTLTMRRPPEEDEKQGYVDMPYEAILSKPATTAVGPVPLVAFIHGGPHSAFSTSWTLTNALFLSVGYATLQINYRGSTGFGDTFCQELLGKVGTLDVRDCHYAIETACDNDESLDRNRVFLFGGSHGGFLGAHLIGQYPKRYKAACLRNPVLDMSVKYSLTDIPDWNIAEALGKKYTQGIMLSDSEKAAFRQRSPITHAHAVRTPLMLMLGMKDLRVVPHHHEYRQILQSNNVPCEVMVYPDSNHSLDEVEVTTESLLNTVRFFERYL